MDNSAANNKGIEPFALLMARLFFAIKTFSFVARLQDNCSFFQTLKQKRNPVYC
jgi:hypothetical protein